MRKLLNFCMVLMTALFLVGCGEKFEPTESTIYVTSKGEVFSAIMEDFDKAYYDFDELSEEVNKEVKSYCLDVNDEVISVEALTKEAGEVALTMKYQTVDDYTKFNEVLLFAGTYEEAVSAGYLPEELHDTEGIITDTESEELDHLKVIVTEESVCIQTAGKIKYVSDNVSIVDKKLARALEAGKGHPAFVLYK